MPLSEIILISMGLLSIAIVAAGLFRHFSIPYTVLLVVIGIGLSELAQFWSLFSPLQVFRLSPDLVFFVFLPALIFESGLSLDARQLLKDLAPVLTLAVPALLISTSIVGFALWAILDIELTVALLFGALISATDPVAVVALFKELGAPLRLNVLVEGESLFNDATAIVVFSILLTMVLQGESLTVGSSLSAIIEFIRVFFGGVVVGTLIGLLVSETLYRLQSGVSAILTMSIVTAYVSFIVAEHSLHVSGVMATVSAAMALSIYGLTRIALDVRQTLTETWEFVGLIANSLLFLLVGLSINAQGLVSHLGLILIVVVIVQLARTASVYTLVPATVRLFKLPRVSLAERHIMWWGGLKGGLAIAIVLSIPESMPGRELLINLTLGVVLFTLIVNAWSIRPLMQRLKLDRMSADETLEMEQGLRAAGASSRSLLDGFTATSVITPGLNKKLNTLVNRVFQPEGLESSSTHHRHEVYLAVIKTEYASLEQLYKTALLSQYSYLDMRHSLQIETDNYRTGHYQEAFFLHPEESVFQKIEMWILRELREKNWASTLLSIYQRTRLAQTIQRAIAGIIMAQAVIDMLQRRSDLDPQLSANLLTQYRQRLHRRQTQLELLRRHFESFFASVEHELFTRSTLVEAQNHTHHEYHQGEIGIKAYNRISQIIQHELQQVLESDPRSGKSIMHKIAAVPLFTGLSETVLRKLSVHAHSVTFLAGDIIIGEGEKGDALYIIRQGSARASRKAESGDQKVIGELEAEDFFGEMAMLGDHVRTASVTAITDMTLLRLTRQDVLQVAQEYDEVRNRLEQVRDNRLAAD
ncbi:MAG: cation:proton antiporter [Gammaproteobacteria bacterium]|nr:cation:proton antiporter [Gammaproteobacteria bacterium]